MIYTDAYRAAVCRARVEIVYPDGARYESANVDPHGALAGLIFGAAYAGRVGDLSRDLDGLRAAHAARGFRSEGWTFPRPGER